LQPVPTLRDFVVNVRKHLEWSVRDRFPNRKVVREVQGVRMVLPWPHRLPDYAGDTTYGQNLVNLARLLAEATPPVRVLDIGANVGDSTLQILHAADARVLCIEADPYYLEYLHLNVGKEPGVEVVEALLTPDERAEATTAVRTGGTTRFTEGSSGDALGSISVAELRARHPDFADLRLVKSDTDGYDGELVPAVAEVWSDSRPVLFFEFDPRQIRAAHLDPYPVWERLAALGYAEVAVWSNGGLPLVRLPIASMAEATSEQERRDAVAKAAGRRLTAYWDVAAVHRDDEAGLRAVRELVP
jgi:FkbM family methyltransferase